MKEKNILHVLNMFIYIYIIKFTIEKIRHIYYNKKKLNFFLLMNKHTFCSALLITFYLVLRRNKLFIFFSFSLAKQFENIY